jgi:hypothetical protein
MKNPAGLLNRNWQAASKIFMRLLNRRLHEFARQCFISELRSRDLLSFRPFGSNRGAHHRHNPPPLWCKPDDPEEI